MNVCAVYEFWVKGKAQNLCVHCCLFLGPDYFYILQGLE